MHGADEKSLRGRSMRSSCPGCADKDLSFAFSEFVICCVHPASLRRGVARDRHDTRGGEAMAAKCRSVSFGCADERHDVDVKSQRADTPMLVSSRDGADVPCGDGGQQARCTRQTAYKREDRRAGKAGRFRLHLWYLPPAFFSQAGRRRQPTPGLPCALCFRGR